MPKKGYIQPPAIIQGNKNLDDLNSLLEVLNDLDEKSLVLAITAFAEDTLGGLLIQYMRDHKQSKDLVDGFSAPLGSFSARCKAALAFGLISDTQYHNLDILRNIRNAIAHNWTGVCLDRDDIAARIQNLRTHKGMGGLVATEGGDRLRSIFTLLLIELRTLKKTLEVENQRVPLVAIHMGPPVALPIEEVTELSPPPVRKPRSASSKS